VAGGLVPDDDHWLSERKCIGWPGAPPRELHSVWPDKGNVDLCGSGPEGLQLICRPLGANTRFRAPPRIQFRLDDGVYRSAAFRDAVAGRVSSHGSGGRQARRASRR
jgi:hypothetical protein